MPILPVTFRPCARGSPKRPHRGARASPCVPIVRVAADGGGRKCGPAPPRGSSRTARRRLCLSHPGSGGHASKREQVTRLKPRLVRSTESRLHTRWRWAGQLRDARVGNLGVSEAPTFGERLVGRGERRESSRDAIYVKLASRYQALPGCQARRAKKATEPSPGMASVRLNPALERFPSGPRGRARFPPGGFPRAPELCRVYSTLRCRSRSP